MKHLNIKEVDTSIFNEFQKRDLQELVKVNEDFSKFYPSAIFIAVSDESLVNCYEYKYIKATYKNLNFCVSYSDHKKIYSIYCDDLKKFENITSYTSQDIEKNIKKPQNIGVLNLKKIIDWFEYYFEIYNELSKVDQLNAKCKNTFLESIKRLNVQWDLNKKGGEIEKNGIVFQFKIHETHISKSVKLLYKVPSTLEAFFKISDNKYLAE